MNLGQLKESLNKFGSDMDTSEVFLLTAANGKREYHLLAATGYMPVDSTAYVALISVSEIERTQSES
jgi:hypothetical protein